MFLGEGREIEELFYDEVSHSRGTAGAEVLVPSSGRQVLGAEFLCPRAKNLGSLGNKYLRR